MSGCKRQQTAILYRGSLACNPHTLVIGHAIVWQASRETWSWIGVSVNKKRACPHLPPRHQTETAVRPMARPAATRENTTVEPPCRRTDGARLPRADSPATGKHTKPLQKWAEVEPANRSTAIQMGKLPSVGVPHGIADAKESHQFTGGRRSIECRNRTADYPLTARMGQRLRAAATRASGRETARCGDSTRRENSTAKSGVRSSRWPQVVPSSCPCARESR